jgi:hypothetical protein
MEKKRQRTKDTISKKRAPKRAKDLPQLNINELICGENVSACPVKLFDIECVEKKETKQTEEEKTVKDEHELLIFFLFKYNNYIDTKKNKN